MKQKFYISLLLISVLTTANINVLGQDLPMVCAGSESKYKVVGLGGSTFSWTITDPNGNPIPATDYTIRHDSVDIRWGVNYEAGIYTFSVTETTVSGCTGAPWNSQHIILNNNTISMPFVGVPTTVAACLGNEVTLDPGLFHNYFWTVNGSTDRTYLTTEAGTYEVRLVDDNQNCTYNDIEAVINPLPYVWLGNDTVLFASQSLTLDVTDPKINTYKWYDNGVDLNLNPLTSTLTVDGLSGNRTYKVTVTDINGCENSDDINIDAADYNNLKIPAAFTPNGDQINDKWVFPRPNVMGDDQELYKYFDNVNITVQVNVFNRWGKLVWESPQKFNFWDGKDLNGRDLPMDSYHYIIRLKVNNKEYMYKGSVTIIR